MTHIRTRFVPSGNARIYIEESGSGAPLLLIHAGIADHRMWKGQLSAFEKYFRVIVPNLRGYGKSSIPDEPFNHFEDMARLLDYLNLKSVNIAGCSIGGRIALELAITYPGIINRLVLIAPGLSGFEYKDRETLAKAAVLDDMIAKGKQNEVSENLVNLWVVGRKRDSQTVDPHIISLVQQMIIENYDSVIDRYPEKEPGVDVISRLGEIKAPTLVLIGDNDVPDMQGISQYVSDKIPGAARQIIPGAGHLPNLEQKRLFNQVVIDFITGRR